MRQTDEIPEAIREKQKRRRSNKPTISVFLITGIIGAAIIGFLLNVLLNTRNISSTVAAKPSTEPTTVASAAASPKNTENILGHLPYSEANDKDLKAISPQGHIRLKKVAADSFIAMQSDARSQGVILQPISGFRSVKEQEYLFFKVKEQRKQLTSKRAEVSAPPGYSEHHTGYAVDIRDGKAPSSDLKQSFEETASFKWLQNNASRYSFEMSFPLNNVQGVSYEPWHWRYVGDQDSLKTFYKAQELKKEAKP